MAPNKFPGQVVLPLLGPMGSQLTMPILKGLKTQAEKQPR